MESSRLAASRISRRLLITILAFASLGCVSSPPKKPNDICEIFKEKRGWYKHTRKAAKRWQGDIPTIVAFIHQESGFVANARPPRRKILWIFPGPRLSDAYGYAQAKKGTWNDYQSASGRWGADRNDFDDASDFVAWYNHQSRKRLKIAKRDAKRLYLAYHEGQGGYKRGTYKTKPWLMKVADKVSKRSSRYRAQLGKCEDDLQSSWWWPF